MLIPCLLKRTDVVPVMVGGLLSWITDVVPVSPLVHGCYSRAGWWPPLLDHGCSSHVFWGARELLPCWWEVSSLGSQALFPCLLGCTDIVSMLVGGLFRGSRMKFPCLLRRTDVVPVLVGARFAEITDVFTCSPSSHGVWKGEGSEVQALRGI